MIMASAVGPLSGLPLILESELEILVKYDQKQRPFIIVTDTTSKKFLQFSTVFDDAIGTCAVRMGIPNQEFSAQDIQDLESFGLQRFPIDCDVKWTWDKVFGTTELAQAATLAKRIFIEIFGSHGDRSMDLEFGVTTTN